MDGNIINTFKVPFLEKSYLSEIIKSFQGDYRQTIPVFSAKKIRGRHLYEYARKNISTDIIKNDVSINKISIIKYQSPYLHLRLSVSSGTYIRAIANDIGERLGCGAAMAKLDRIRIGKFLVKDSVEAEEAVDILNNYNKKEPGSEKISDLKAIIPVKKIVKDYKKVYVKERYINDLEMNSPLYEEMIEPKPNFDLEFKPGEIIVIRLGKTRKSFIHRAISEFSLKKISNENKKLSKFLLIN